MPREVGSIGSIPAKTGLHQDKMRNKSRMNEKSAQGQVFITSAEGPALESMSRSAGTPDGLEVAISAGGSGPPRAWGALTLPKERSDLHPWDQAHRAVT